MNRARRTAKRATGILIAAVTMVLLMAAQVLEQVGTWSLRAPLPNPRKGVSASIHGTLFMLGNGEVIDFWQSLVAYDPKADSWTSKASLPTPRCCMSLTTLDGKLYAIGGQRGLGGGSPVDSVEVYDPISDEWSAKAPLPEPRTSPAAAGLDGKVYVVGGYTPDGFGGLSHSSTLLVYDPTTNTWINKAPMPTPRAAVALVAVEGVLYAIGGTNFGASTAVEAYDPKTDTWIPRAPMPTARVGPAAAVVDGMVYAAGGDRGFDPIATRALSVVEAYDPSTDTWSSVPPMPTARVEFGLSAVENTLYAVGGMQGTEREGWAFLVVNEAFSPFLTVTIDIKPGDPNNTINLNSRATILVAILSSAEFDALTVDPASLTLANARVVTTNRGTAITSIRDVDRDGRLDLVVHFRIEDLQLSPTDTEAILRGATFSGQRLRGADSVRVLPERPLGQNDARGRQRR